MTIRNRLRALKESLVQEIDATHPAALSRCDVRDGVGAALHDPTHPKRIGPGSKQAWDDDEETQ